MSYRLYSFVANHYLSPLQCGLQTAHVVSEIAVADHLTLSLYQSFRDWAQDDKTIIICGAGNHQGVLNCWAELKRTAVDPGFVTGAIFREDEQSMNGMATACGVIVPQRYWDVTYDDGIENGLGYERYVHAVKNAEGAVTNLYQYTLDTPIGQFIKHLKSYRLA